ncbi:MAG: cytidine deaminase [Streptococcaceae bacterium]|jgi:cytidine deaminase|nr:cytidine deaminase [Streptococcaceae bacterium]
MTTDELIEAAIKASQQAYTPYSHFAVGASVVTNEGSVYTGCNIENISYGLTNCAERTAIFKAVSEGAKGFSAIYIYAHSERLITPCGACLQVMSEFFTSDTLVYLIGKDKRLQILTFKELLPYRFEILS